MNITILLLGCIADTYLMYLFFSHYFEEQRFLTESKMRYLIYILFVGIWFVSNLLGNGNYNLFISAALIFLYVVLFLQGKYGYKLLCYVLLFVIQFGCEFLFMIIFQPDAESYKKSADTAFQTIAVKFLTYFIIILIAQFTGRAKAKISRKILIMYLCLPLASITVMIINFYAGTYLVLSEKMKILVFLGYCFLFAGNIVVFYAFHLHSEKSEEILQQQLVLTKQGADLMLYNKVMRMNEMQKELVHNTKHHLFLIRKYAEQNDVESILQMTMQLSDNIRENERIIFTNNSVLNALLNEKYAEAQKYGIDTDFYVEPGVMVECISPIDFISMLGNLLDNAIYAAKSCMKKKYIKVYVYMQDVDGFCVVKVVNGYSGTLQYEDENLKSTKSEKGIHGVGLQSVKRLAEKYEGTLIYDAKDNIFEAVLILSTV